MRHRSVTALGPLMVSVTSTSTAAKLSGWFQFGPVMASQITVGAAFGSTSSTGAKITVQGWLSTALSTGTIFTIATRTYAQRTATIASTVALMANFVRLRTTGSASSSALQTIYLAARG